MNNAGFTKADRSSFAYWFAHWCAFNMTALNLGAWKFKYLFHDWEKPWLRLFLPYDKVQRWHRNHRKHHIEYFAKRGTADWEAMVIDWECSRYTKKEAQMTAVETLQHECGKHSDVGCELHRNIYPVLRKFKLNTY